MPVESHGVGVHDGDAGFVHDRAQDGHEMMVDLDRRHRGARGRQGQGERAKAGTDLHDPVAGPDGGEAGDAPHGVRIDDEVLPQGPAGPDAVLFQQSLHLAPGQCHCPTVARLTTRFGRR